MSEIAVDDSTGKARAVVLNDGTEICSNFILSNATAKVTFSDLLDTVIVLKFCLNFLCFGQS